MSEPENKSVADLMWPWKTRSPAVQKTASHVGMALLQAAVACTVASFLVFYKQHYILGGVLYALGALVLIGGLFIPPLHAAFTRFGQRLGVVVGIGTTWLLLVPFYYLFFTTARIGLLLQGKDPLARRFERNATTYWVDRGPITDDKHFLRQS
jgi:predicted membrane metal-binding protein